MKRRALSFGKARDFGYEIDGLIEIEMKTETLFAIFEKKKGKTWSKSN